MDTPITLSDIDRCFGCADTIVHEAHGIAHGIANTVNNVSDIIHNDSRRNCNYNGNGYYQQQPQQYVPAEIPYGYSDNNQFGGYQQPNYYPPQQGLYPNYGVPQQQQQQPACCSGYPGFSSSTYGNSGGFR